MDTNDTGAMDAIHMAAMAINALAMDASDPPWKKERHEKRRTNNYPSVTRTKATTRTTARSYLGCVAWALHVELLSA